MKYVMFCKETKGMTVFHPVIFPSSLVHADIAAAMTGARGPLAGCNVDSAGEISLFDNDFECFGKSTTLDVESNPERDTRIIKMNDYGAGFL